MKFNVFVSKTFQKKFLQLQSSRKSSIRKSLKELQNDPYSPRVNCDIKPLKETKPKKYRLRIGNYRIIYMIDKNEVKIIDIIQREADLECVWQMTVRDVNKLGIAGMVMGAHALGIRNVLSLTGDHTALGDMPESKPVFDLDSATLVQLVREMVDKGTINGNEIEAPPTLHVGAAANPNANPMGAEILKIARKAEAGCEFIQTQCVYDLDITAEFLSEIKKYNVPVLLGIFPMYPIYKIYGAPTMGK